MGLGADSDLDANDESKLINEADAEAQSPEELQAMKSLHTVQGLHERNISIRHILLVYFKQAWAMSNKQGDVLEAYSKYPDVARTFDQDKTCQASLEASLRARTYTDLPASCTPLPVPQ